MNIKKLNDKKNTAVIIFIFSGIFIVGGFFYINNKVFATGFAGVDTTAKIAICGNNVKEATEQCDGADLGGASCISRGFIGGTLSCRPSCDFNTSACTSAGGGGGGNPYVPTATLAPAPTVVQTSRCSNLSKSSDINNDGSVDVFDFNLLMVKWGSVSQNILADINCDGSVDVFDFNLLMVNWGKSFQ